MITLKNESKILTKNISRECKCKFDGRKCNSNQKWNNDKTYQTKNFACLSINYHYIIDSC